MGKLGKFGLLAFVVVVGAAGCTKSNPISCVDGYCQDPAFPFCDSDGAIAGDPQTCIAVTCTPNSFAGCRMNQAIVCNAAGGNYDLSHCDNGCDPALGCVQNSCIANTVSCGQRVVERCDENGVLHTQACDLSCIETPAPHCAYISPKYLPDICDIEAVEPARSVTAPETLDTATSSVCNGGVIPQVNAPEICIVRYRTVTVTAAGAMRFVGTRAVAIVADDTLSVNGRLDVSAQGQVGAPGSVRNVNASGGSSAPAVGGGGAGFSSSGAAGGSTTQPGGATNGGPGFSPLVASSLGGGTIASLNGPRRSDLGGGGGGALTLVSCRGSVNVTGVVEASGGGGLGGRTVLDAVGSFIAGGGGGGSGGYVVLQGLHVAVSGAVYANGGSGGCGKPSTGAQGINGADGRTSPPAACVASSNEGSGGAGASSAFVPQVGGASSGGTPGGGGGAMGFFQAHTPIGIIPTLTPANASPPFQQSLNVSTR